MDIEYECRVQASKAELLLFTCWISGYFSTTNAISCIVPRREGGLRARTHMTHLTHRHTCGAGAARAARRTGQQDSMRVGTKLGENDDRFHVDRHDIAIYP
jgi:hypothetical protein